MGNAGFISSTVVTTRRMAMMNDEMPKYLRCSAPPEAIAALPGRALLVHSQARLYMP